MTAHVSLVRVEDGRELIDKGATCAMKGQARDYWPEPDELDRELRELLATEGGRDGTREERREATRHSG